METTANTECGGVRHLALIKAEDLEKGFAVVEVSMGYQLVGVVKAHQG